MPYQAHNLDKRESLANAAIDGAVSMFGLAVADANALYAMGCSGTLLASLGVIEPAAALGSISTCLGVMALLAVLNFASYAVSPYNDQDGWHYDDYAETSGQILGGHAIMELDSNYRHITKGLYTLRNVTIHPLSMSLIDLHAAEHKPRLLSAGPIFSLSLSGDDVVGHQMVMNMDAYNVSVMASTEGFEDALRTLSRYQPGKDCPSFSRK